MFSLENEEYAKIKIIFNNFEYLLTKKFEAKIKKAIRVLHFKYLWGSCREAQIILLKYDLPKNVDLFELIMSVYNKKRKEHQAKFLLLHCFENALRSTLAIHFANKYNTDKDDWFLRSIDISNTMDKRIRRRCKNIDIEKINTFEIFDCFYMIDLQEILEEHWDIFLDIFQNPVHYKNQELPCYNKTHLNVKIGQIRMARNEIFHNKPTKIRFQKDLEILLLRMGYNLQEAIKIDNIAQTIHLQYKYD